MLIFKRVVFALISVLTLYIRRMRVSKFPSIRPSRYGRKIRKCWSQIALGPMAEKLFSGPCSKTVLLSRK